MNPWMAVLGSLIVLAATQLAGTMAILWLAGSKKRH